MMNYKSEMMRYSMNPPYVVSPELGKVIAASLGQGKVLEIKPDNRYKDGNIKIVRGVVRGNSKTVKVARYGDEA